MFSRILLAVDFSSQSVMALRMAAALCEGTDRDLIVLSVCDVSDTLYLQGIFGTSAYALKKGEKQVMESAQDKLAEISMPLESMGIKHRKLLRQGTPSKIILETASELECDLIVIGTHSRKTMFDRLIGGTTTTVVKNALCPVLVASPSDQSEV